MLSCHFYLARCCLPYYITETTHVPTLLLNGHPFVCTCTGVILFLYVLVLFSKQWNEQWIFQRVECANLILVSFKSYLFVFIVLTGSVTRMTLILNILNVWMRRHHWPSVHHVKYKLLQINFQSEYITF